MRGTDEASGSHFSHVDLEARIPARHPLRKIRQVVNEALASLDGEFAALETAFGRPSIAPLLPDDRFSVDGTLVKARASMKSLQPKAGGPSIADTEDQPEANKPETNPMPRPHRQSRNAEVDFRGENRSNATHAWTSIPMPGFTRSRRAPAPCSASSVLR